MQMKNLHNYPNIWYEHTLISYNHIPVLLLWLNCVYDGFH